MENNGRCLKGVERVLKGGDGLGRLGKGWIGFERVSKGLKGLGRV